MQIHVYIRSSPGPSWTGAGRYKGPGPGRTGGKSGQPGDLQSDHWASSSGTRGTVNQTERQVDLVTFSLAVCRFQSLVDGEGETRFKTTQRGEDQRPSLLQSGEAAGRQSAKRKEPIGSFTMEDLLHFNESDSLFIADGCLTPKVALAWKHLRLAVRHHFRKGTPLQPEGLRRIILRRTQRLWRR